MVNRAHKYHPNVVGGAIIIVLMRLFFYNKIGSIIPTVVLPTTEIIEPENDERAKALFFLQILLT